MNIKKSILTSTILGALYVTSAHAGLACEHLGNGTSICEAVTANPQENTYVWSGIGNASVSDNGFAFATAYCSGTGFPMCSVQVSVTYPNGNTSTWSTSISPNSGGQAGGSGSGACGWQMTVHSDGVHPEHVGCSLGSNIE